MLDRKSNETFSSLKKHKLNNSALAIRRKRLHLRLKVKILMTTPNFELNWERIAICFFLLTLHKLCQILHKCHLNPGWVLLNSLDVVSEPPQHNSPNPLTKEGNSPKQLTREEDNSPQQENSPHLTRREDDDRAVSPPVVQRHPLSPPSPRLSSSPPHLPPGSSSPASPPRFQLR